MEKITLEYTSVKSSPITHSNILDSMKGKNPEECVVNLIIALNRSDLKWTDLCKCTGRSIPKCKPCQNGRSTRTESEIDSIIRDVEQRVRKNFQEKLDDIKKFFLACKGFTNFLSSSILLINLQNMYFQGRKSNTLSFDLESTFEKYVRKYQGNSLSQSGKRCGCGLGDDISGIYRHVRMPTSSGSIFPDFAEISIRGELLALSMSMKVLFRLAPLHHLHNNVKKQMHLMREIAQYICRMFFRKQMRKCK